MGSRFPVTVVAAVVALFATAASAATEAATDVVDGFIARTHLGAGNSRIPYRLFVPAAQARERPLPLIIYLHGSGGAGTDNLKQISGANTDGTHLWATRDLQSRHPAFVIAPQAPTDAEWGAPGVDELAVYAALVVDLIGKLSKEFAIDADRLYLMGQSRGGRGTWDLVSKRPNLFAAAVPLCGYGNAARIRAARHVPIWAFHGAKDATVPVSGSRDLVAALRNVGSSVRYTEYPEVAHNVWTVAFTERELPEWLFAQKRTPH